MTTQSNLPLVTANFQKLSNEELFNGLITLIIPINIRLLENSLTRTYTGLSLQLLTNLCQENSITPCCICAITYTPENYKIDQLLSLISSID